MGARQRRQCEPRPGGRGHQERDWKGLGRAQSTSGVEGDRKESLGRTIMKGVSVKLRVWESP